MKPRTGKLCAQLTNLFMQAANGVFDPDQKMSTIFRTNGSFKEPDTLDITSGSGTTVVLANASLNEIDQIKHDRAVIAIELPQTKTLLGHSRIRDPDSPSP